MRLGEYNLSTEQDCSPDAGCNSPPVDIAIEKLIPHPEYFKPELRNDIALIKLAEKVEFKECKFLSTAVITLPCTLASRKTKVTPPAKTLSKFPVSRDNP